MFDGLFTRNTKLVEATNLVLNILFFGALVVASSFITWMVKDAFFQPTYSQIQKLAREDGANIAELSFVCRDDKKLPKSCQSLYKAITGGSPLPTPPPLMAAK